MEKPPATPPTPPRHPGLLDWNEESLAKYRADCAEYENLQREHEAQQLAALPSQDWPHTKAFIAEDYRTALRGDARGARAHLLAVAEKLQASEAPVFGEHERKFIAEALRRVAANSRAVNVVCDARKHKGGKEKSARPTESRKAMSIALFIARHRRTHGGSVEAAIAEVRTKSWAIRDVRTIKRYWAKHRLVAERLVEETPLPLNSADW